MSASSSALTLQWTSIDAYLGRTSSLMYLPMYVLDSWRRTRLDFPKKMEYIKKLQIVVLRLGLHSRHQHTCTETASPCREFKPIEHFLSISMGQQLRQSSSEQEEQEDDV